MTNSFGCVSFMCDVIKYVSTYLNWVTWKTDMKQTKNNEMRYKVFLQLHVDCNTFCVPPLQHDSHKTMCKWPLSVFQSNIVCSIKVTSRKTNEYYINILTCILFLDKVSGKSSQKW